MVRVVASGTFFMAKKRSSSPKTERVDGLLRSIVPFTDLSLRTLTVDRDPNGIVVVSFDVPDRSLNVLTREVLEELAYVLDHIQNTAPPTGLVLVSARAGSFFAGADLQAIDQLFSQPEERIRLACDSGRALFARLSTQPWPSVSVIEGLCLGGGLELALACDLRIAIDSPNTSLGLPEVKLGLLPGWGGTVRLPRLVGLSSAVEMIAGGESVSPQKAFRMGLIDEVVSSELALAAAKNLIAEQLGNRQWLQRRKKLAEPINIDPVEVSFLEATAGAVIGARAKGRYPAPPRILATLLEASQHDAALASSLESDAFFELAHNPVTARLIGVFHLGQRNARDPGIPRADLEPLLIESVGVVGAGIMGCGIAASHIRHDFSVSIVDVSELSLSKAIPPLLEEAAWDRESRAALPSRALELAGRLRSSTMLSSLRGSQLIIESVVERSDIKQAVLGELESMIGPETILATNTSTNPIEKLARCLSYPERFLGMHFFNPVRRMTLVEIIRGPATSDQTIVTVVAHAKRLGKCPIVVRDSPGFLVNRVLMPYLHEAVEMVREGVDVARIDRLSRRFGMPMGPLELYDMIGLDTAFYAGVVLSTAFGERIESSPVIPAMVRSGRLGRKSSAGFYQYSPKGKMLKPDQTIYELIEPYQLRTGEWSDDQITDRLFLPIVQEAALVLDEQIVREACDIDLAVIHGLGFPAFRGGLLAWADSLGASDILMRLKQFESLGSRMRPAPRLLDMARRGGSFYASMSKGPQ